MSTTDTSEKGLETLIVESLVNEANYVQGDPKDYDREHALDLAKLLAFMQATQPEAVAQLELDRDSPRRLKFLARLTGEIAKRGVVDVLRKGVADGNVHVDLFFGTPSPGNAEAAKRHAQNIFSVTRQLRYSQDTSALALDAGLFINGLPVATFELKNRLTKQTVDDAVQQYKNDRDPREKLFEFGRFLVHFAVDDQEVRFCTHLQGKASWFLPFNKGYNDGAGNPPNPNGLKTDYLWKVVLAKPSLTDILENYAGIIESKDEKTGRKKKTQIFPRYHQLDVVRKLLADAEARGPGKRYLVQHSAGSGKSNSIAWLTHQLIGLERGDASGGGAGTPLFDSVIVVTDRRVLDQQIRETIKKFAQVSAIIGAVREGTGQSKTQQLAQFLRDGKRIIITTVQTFPFVMDAIGSEHRGRTFAVVIDEAHSSQGGRTAAQMNMALAANGEQAEDESTEDAINRIMESRKMLDNASYFAFTATPKNKTLEVFGEAFDDGGDPLDTDEDVAAVAPAGGLFAGPFAGAVEVVGGQGPGGDHAAVAHLDGGGAVGLGVGQRGVAGCFERGLDAPDRDLVEVKAVAPAGLERLDAQVLGGDPFQRLPHLVLPASRHGYLLVIAGVTHT